MSNEHERLIVAEVSRKLKKDHYFYDDMLQEARIALLLALHKIDKNKTRKQQYFFLRNAVRWHVSKTWRAWLKDVLLVSERSLQKRTADMRKRENLDDFDWSDFKVADSGMLPDEEAHLHKQREKLKKALDAVVRTEEDAKLISAVIHDVDCRTLGKQIGKSHQGALNTQKRLLEKLRKRVK